MRKAFRKASANASQSAGLGDGGPPRVVLNAGSTWILRQAVFSHRKRTLPGS